VEDQDGVGALRIERAPRLVRERVGQKGPPAVQRQPLTGPVKSVEERVLRIQGIEA
jgi:hypothetical protein